MKRMTIRGHEGMLGARPRNPDLPPDPELPPPDGRMSVRFIRKLITVDAYSAETVLSVARAHALATLQAERERVATATPPTRKE